MASQPTLVDFKADDGSTEGVPVSVGQQEVNVVSAAVGRSGQDGGNELPRGGIGAHQPPFTMARETTPFIAAFRPAAVRSGCSLATPISWSSFCSISMLW